MMTPLPMLAALLLAVPLIPAAQAETLLRLSESAYVSARPDELAASLRFEVEAPDAATAQSRVNAAMAKALAEAKATSGVGTSRANTLARTPSPARARATSSENTLLPRRPS